MGEQTNISWCDATFNPWLGCQKVSPACDGCYAEAMMDKRYGRVQWGAPGKGNGTRERTSAGNWSKPKAWDRKAKADGTRPFVFCASLADVFDNQVPPEWRRDLFELIRATPNLVWLLLTKRPQLIVKLVKDAGFMPENIALGTTVEDQERADTNVPALLYAKATLKPLFAFLSCEPLLGPIDLHHVRRYNPTGQPWIDALTGIVTRGDYLPRSPAECGMNTSTRIPGELPSVDWVITGGETDQGGHRARPSSPQWFRDLRDRCSFAGIAYHHKQNGEWVSVSEVAGPGQHFTFPDGRTVRRIGKARSGRTIDGIEHNARPEVRHA